MFRFSLTLFFCLFLQWTIDAQLTLQAGYNGAYFNPTITNQILADFDTRNADLGWDNPFGSINIASGVTAGFHYRIDDFGMEFKWYNQSSNPKASGIVNEEELFHNLYIRNNSYGIALQGYLTDAVSVGAGAEYQVFTIKNEGTGQTQRASVLREGTFAGRAFIDIAVARGTISAVHIRPYVQFPLKEVNIFALEQELNPDNASNAMPENYNEQLLNFGISLFFSNGEQY